MAFADIKCRVMKKKGKILPNYLHGKPCKWMLLMKIYLYITFTDWSKFSFHSLNEPCNFGTGMHNMYTNMNRFFGGFFYLGFTALSRIFHLYQADRSSKVGENRSTRRKTTWPSISRTWLSHIWTELGSNHSGEKPNGLRVNSLIH